VNSRQRRRRAFTLLAIAAACGGLAASEVGKRAADAERRGGPAVPVVVAARPIAAGAELRLADLVVDEVPRRYAPRDAPRTPAQAVGLRTAGPVAAGSPITASLVGEGRKRPPGGLRHGERALEIAVAGGAALLTAVPGTRVDVLVSTEPGAGAGRSFVALEDVELLALQPGVDALASDVGGERSGAGATSALATLRVTLRQAVYLTAAQSFARELRLLPRPVGDRRRIGPAGVSSDDL
jgi:pilus assembly protein CpaB